MQHCANAIFYAVLTFESHLLVVLSATVFCSSIPDDVDAWEIRAEMEYAEQGL